MKKKRLIVCSQINTASKNMHKIFTRELGFKPTIHKFDQEFVFEKDNYQLINIKKSIIDLDYLNDFFSPEVYIIASTHRSEKPHKTLTCHVPGNYNENKLGGNAREIAIAPALFLRSALLELKTHKQEPGKEFDICFEVTHHGPSKMNAPILFVEVGSQETEWNDIEACRTAGQAMLTEPKNIPTAIAFGSSHYASNFSKDYVLEQFAIGHICPKYAVENIDEHMLKQMINNTYPTPKLAIIDWKGLSGPQKKILTTLLDKINFKWVKLSELKQ
jgi:D-aminoacyl-tRNA deacylase